MLPVDMPRIGLTLDYESGGGYSKLPWYAIRENYCTAVSELGALAIPMPHELDKVPAWLDLLDGLIATGGDFDIDPSYYGEAITSERVSVKERRTAFELSVANGMIERKKPVLGICGGQQLLAVALGGTLIQHIPDTVQNPLAHEQPNPRHEPGHSVSVKAGTRLREIVGTDRMEVNSAHHQAVKDAGKRAVVNAIAPDGVIEGIELPEHPFCIGVQWHPEYHVDRSDRLIFQSFVHACKH